MFLIISSFIVRLRIFIIKLLDVLLESQVPEIEKSQGTDILSQLVLKFKVKILQFNVIEIASRFLSDSRQVRSGCLGTCYVSIKSNFTERSNSAFPLKNNQVLAIWLAWCQN